MAEWTTFDKVLGGIALFGTFAGTILAIRTFINNVDGEDED